MGIFTLVLYSTQLDLLRLKYDKIVNVHGKWSRTLLKESCEKITGDFYYQRRKGNNSNGPVLMTGRLFW